MDIDTAINAVLKEASQALIQLKDDYFIIGAAALVLSGIKTDTFDIDILVSHRDAVYLQQVWNNRIIRNHNTQRDDLFRSTFARYHFGELDIEILGDLKVCKDGIWTPLSIQDYFTLDIGNNIEVKLPTLDEQKRIFNLFGREKDFKKIAMIENYK